jgi:MoaE-MoaD fusion protein
VSSQIHSIPTQFGRRTVNWDRFVGSDLQVTVLFFGMLKDLAGRGRDSLTLPEHATLSDVLDHYVKEIPRLKEFAASVAMSVNQEYAGPETKLKSRDEIALLPPVSGGSPHCGLVHEIIDAQNVIEKIKHPEDGATVIFDGIVRNNTRGRRTLYLDYEAYEEMALKQMEELAAQALTQFEVRDIAIRHRLGRLEIGETSVLIVVASAHRAAAFDACRWLIDTLKSTVPIWKKEHFEDGAVWAAGEPFPAEIRKPKAPIRGGLTSK